MLGNNDATVNLAIYYLSDKFTLHDKHLGIALMKMAWRNGNKKAADHMVQLGLINDEKELETEVVDDYDMASGVTSEQKALLAADFRPYRTY